MFYSTCSLFREENDLLIQKLVEEKDLIIYFGNIPPFIRHSTKTILFQSNRLLIENYPLSKYPLKTRFRLYLEKFLVRLYINKVDEIIVDLTKRIKFPE